MTPEQQKALALAAARRRRSEAQAQPAQQEPAGFMERLGTGVTDPVIGLNQFLYNVLPQPAQRGVDWLTQQAADVGLTTPMPPGGYNEFVRQREAAIAQQAPEGVDWARILGNVASPVNVLPAAAGLGRAAAQGGRIAQGMGLGGFAGGTTPVTEGDYETELAKNVALGMVTGAAGAGAVEGVSRVVSPRASIDPAIRALRGQDVPVTPGQALGGVPGKLEEKLVSVPVMGEAIAARRGEAMTAFNKAMVNRAGRSIGFKTAKSGADAISDLDTAVGKAYNEAIDKTKGVVVDEEFLTNVRNLSEMAADVADAGQTKTAFDRQAKIILEKISKGGKILPETWKELDAKVGKLASKGANEDFKQAMRQLQIEWRDVAARSNPEQAQLFREADQAYSGLQRLLKASTASVGGGGEFTPGQLFTAARQQAPTKRSLAQGTAPFLKEAREAQRVLGATVPSSGTVDRALAAGGIGALGVMDPTTLLAPAIGTAIYSRPLSQALTATVAARPRAAEPLAQALRRTSPFVGLGTAQAIE